MTPQNGSPGTLNCSVRNTEEVQEPVVQAEETPMAEVPIEISAEEQGKELGASGY